MFVAYWTNEAPFLMLSRHVMNQGGVTRCFPQMWQRCFFIIWLSTNDNHFSARDYDCNHWTRYITHCCITYAFWSDHWNLYRIQKRSQTTGKHHNFHGVQLPVRCSRVSKKMRRLCVNYNSTDDQVCMISPVHHSWYHLYTIWDKIGCISWNRDAFVENCLRSNVKLTCLPCVL